MQKARFLKANEVVEIITYMYSIDTQNVKMTLTAQEISNLAQKYQQRVQDDTGAVCAVYDDENNIIGTYTAIEYPELAAWRIAGTKIIESTNHYAKTARLLSPGIDAMISYMEAKGYYKWWMISPESHHNVRNKIMCKYSTMLQRYDWYDDLVIPPNTEKTGVSGFDDYREIIDWSDTVARLFVLKQKHRIDIFKGKNFTNYKGTLPNDTMVE
jgi:L-amino acid N-acyltransferase YncA